MRILDTTKDGADLVTIVVPAFNAEQTITGCLHSILANTYKNIEVLVCDDSSSDLTADVVVRIQAEDSRVRVIRHLRRMGPAFARNRGIEESRGQFVFFTDADVIVEKQWIENGVAALSQDEVVGVEGNIFLNHNADMLHQKIPINPFYPKLNSSGQLNFPGQDFAASNIAYRSNELRKVGGFDATRFSNGREDTDLAWRMMVYGKIAYAPGMKVYHASSRWNFYSLVENSVRYQRDVSFLKTHGHFFYKRGILMHPRLLMFLVFPPSIFRHYRFRSLKELLFVFPFYFYLLKVRIEIWKAAIKERTFVV